MRVLVAYASKHGSTTVIASVIATSLRDAGFEVDCLSVEKVERVDAYDAVVIGSALYAGRWLARARRFVVRHRRALRAMPVSMFSSGPLDDSASTSQLPAPPRVAALARSIGCGEHATFGGRLSRYTTGLIAGSVAKKHAGDYRDWPQIRRWAERVGDEIRSVVTTRAPQRMPSRWLLVALCLVVAATASIGGLALLAAPSGALLHAPLALLAHTPFETFAIPGLLLFGVIGMSSVVAAIEVAHDAPRANQVAGFAGIALGVWILVESLMFRMVTGLQVAMFAIAIAIVFEALRRWRSDCSFAAA
ncbi:MAG: flavodoxin domain-containing protein [Kofleriaceae bacterium]